jgi:hypothetical protein
VATAAYITKPATNATVEINAKASHLEVWLGPVCGVSGAVLVSVSSVWSIRISFT